MAYAKSTTGSGVAKSLTAHRCLCDSRNGPSVRLGRTAPVSEYDMPSHLFADRPAASRRARPGRRAHHADPPPARADVDAVRREAVVDDGDPQGRWQRALCELAVHQLDDLGRTLGQLREGLPEADPRPSRGAAPTAPRNRPSRADRRSSLLSRVGSAEWNLLTDEVSWSDELFQIFGRDPEARPADAGRAAVPGLPGGPGPAHHDGDGLSGGRPADRRRVPHRPARRRGAHGAHDGRARARRRRLHRVHVGGPAGRQRTAPQPAGSARDP